MKDYPREGLYMKKSRKMSQYIVLRAVAAALHCQVTNSDADISMRQAAACNILVVIRQSFYRVGQLPNTHPIANTARPSSTPFTC